MRPTFKQWGLALLGCISIIPVLIGPIITGVLVDYGGFTNTEAGLTAGYSAIGSVAVAVLCALNMHRLPLRRLATVGTLSLAISNLAGAMLYSDLPFFYSTRVLAAFGAGALYASVMSGFARDSRSERNYGLFMMLQFGLASLGLWSLPTFFPDMTAGQMYLGFSAVNLAALGLIRLLPSDAANDAGVAVKDSEWHLLLSVPALGCLAALFFFEGSNVGTDAFIERIAVFGGYSDREIGAALGVASLCGVPGAFAIFFVGSRFGHRVPVIAGTVVGAVSLTGLMQANSYGVFFLWTCVHSMSWAFTTPYIQSLLADLDPGGAVVTAGGIASGAGGGVGPAVMAVMVTSEQYQSVLWVGLAAYGLAAIAISTSVLRQAK